MHIVTPVKYPGKAMKKVMYIRQPVKYIKEDDLLLRHNIY